MSGAGLSEVSTEPSPAARGSADRFRPDLEGLRAIAVLLVLLYHAGVPGFGGGYVGVDVFFVLSGFLITGIIVRELRDTGTIRLAAFYARRARRLLPAAGLVLLVTVLASAIVLPPLRVPDVAADGAAAAVYASNIRFAVLATDYLQAELAPSPLLHYWSLGVEEQFYLFWPALLLVVARAGGRSIGRLAAVVVAVGVASFALSVLLTRVNAPWAFYSLPTRAWELALGAILALAAVRGVVAPRAVAAVAAVVGVAMIVAAGALFHTGTPFPGTASLLPTAGAALVIAAGLGSAVTAPSRLLSVAPLRFLGRISYSLYLWHWPMLVIPAAALGEALPFGVRLLLAAATIPIAAASQRWVEEPIRRGRWVGLRTRRSLALAGTLTAVLAVSSVAVGMAASSRLGSNGVGSAPPDLTGVLGTPAQTTVPWTARPRTPPPGSSPSPSPSPSLPAGPTPAPTTAGGPVPANLRPSLLDAREDLPAVYDNGCHVVQLVTTSPPCEFGNPASPTTVVLYGDSHAAMWFPTFERLAVENDWRLISLTKALCAAVDHPVWNGGLKRGYPECDAWRDAALERIADVQPALVVVVNSKFASLEIGGREATAAETAAAWEPSLARMLGTLDAAAGAVVLIGDTPQAAVDPPVCLSANLDDVLACATPMAQAIDAHRLAADRLAAERAGVSFIDPTPLVCPTDPCPAVIGNLLVFHDSGHLTRTFAAALAPYLGAWLPRID